MAVDPMQMQQAYAMQQGANGAYDPYGGQQLDPQGWGSFFRRALPVAVNVARQFIPQDATQQMLAAQYAQQGQQVAPQSILTDLITRHHPEWNRLPYSTDFLPRSPVALPFDATQQMLAAQYGQQGQQFAPQGWLGDLAGQYGGTIGSTVGGWLGNRHLGQQIGGTLGNIAQQYSPFDASQQMLAAQYGQQAAPQQFAAGYDPYGGQLAPQGWGSFFRRALPIAVDVARQFIPQDATQQMLAAQYAQQGQQLDPQGYWGNMIGKYAQPVGSIVGGIAGNQQLGSQIGGTLGNIAQQYLPYDASQQMLAAQYAQPQQQLAPQGYWGDQITKYAQPVGSIVGGIAGNQQLGSQIGSVVGGLGRYVPFDATQQMLAAQYAQQQQLAQQQYAQQLDPQGFFGGLAGKVLGGVGGRVVGGWLGNKQLGETIGSMAGGAAGSFLPFQAGPMPQMPQSGYGPGFGYGY